MKLRDLFLITAIILLAVYTAPIYFLVKGLVDTYGGLIAILFVIIVTLVIVSVLAKFLSERLSGEDHMSNLYILVYLIYWAIIYLMGALLGLTLPLAFLPVDYDSTSIIPLSLMFITTGITLVLLYQGNKTINFYYRIKEMSQKKIKFVVYLFLDVVFSFATFCLFIFLLPSSLDNVNTMYSTDGLIFISNFCLAIGAFMNVVRFAKSVPTKFREAFPKDSNKKS